MAASRALIKDKGEETKKCAIGKSKFPVMFLAGFLTMTVDETNSYLVTGDAEGVIKVWDISEYCAACTADDDSPPRKSIFDI